MQAKFPQSIRHLLPALAGYRTRRCVSLYLPLPGAPPATDAHRLALQDALVDLEIRLGVVGTPRLVVKEMLAPIWGLSEEEAFWADAAPGLALLLSHDRLLSFWLSEPPPPRSLIGRRFHLGPLLEEEPLTPARAAALRSEIERLSVLTSTSRASADLEEIVNACREGTVETLFVVGDHPVWGSYDPASGAVRTDLPPSAPKEDLLDLATSQALLHGARVYQVSNQLLPGEAEAAAILTPPPLDVATGGD